ncbi:major facilitator superfamily transporter [Grosmannia clavigera kw1407]|uniref:Major facilitator superfamily transporter n=1 Tax=Grosmannia clavigera (strain kw1407 / UAMH 11150) TaxID=655863 RepID=F0X928_GROCL|nr:major facilitator superfamily transporter [Grosmannia clavigera kw1407]EFX05441.1 major facilitator superfamily transporter [Grosmannia clavigera kw1407]
MATKNSGPVVASVALEEGDAEKVASHTADLTSVSADAGPPYTVFSLRTRWLIVVLLGYLGLASTLTANIYFPLLDLLAARYAVSPQAINLTITLYFVVQGIAPSFWSPLSDRVGRRPIFLATFIVYTLASAGLSAAPSNSYAVLLLLRAMQSVGASAVLSMAYAAVADVTVHTGRGCFLAPMMTAVNIGTCVGPVVGGAAVLRSGDPRWCFRTLLAFGASGFLLIGLALPETARSVVGNGSTAARGLCRTWWSMAHIHARPSRIKATSKGQTRRCTFCVQTSISPAFSRIYGFDPLQVGLCFLAGGAGILAGGLIASRLLDHNYRHMARNCGLPVDRVRGLDSVAHFPLEHARTHGSVRILTISLAAVVGYGWVLDQPHGHIHPAVPLLLQAFLACKCTILLQTYSALAVDVFPKRTGTAAAANNITRCLLAAGAVAALDPLAQALGYGWVFTLLGLLDAVAGVAAVLALRRWGPL